jgi:hypothetical protein
MKRLHDSNPSHKGLKYIRTYDETFEVEGPHGTHVVLVQEPMREPLGQFRRRFEGEKLPAKILQGFMQVSRSCESTVVEGVDSVVVLAGSPRLYAYRGSCGTYRHVSFPDNTLHDAHSVQTSRTTTSS